MVSGTGSKCLASAWLGWVKDSISYGFDAFQREIRPCFAWDGHSVESDANGPYGVDFLAGKHMEGRFSRLFEGALVNGGAISLTALGIRCRIWCL